MRSAVLAGGAASRFGGRAKGLELVGGARILDRVVDAVREATGGDPLLVANAAEAKGWYPGLETVSDVLPNCGSLGGIYTAVTTAEGPVLVVAWDMPFVPPGLIDMLASAVAEADVVIPASAGRRGVEPLCAAYGLACAAPMRRRIEAKDLRAIAFHEEVRVSILSLDTIRHFGDPDVLFFNVNTPEDLTKADRLWQRHASSR